LAEVMSSGRSFHVHGPTTGKDRLATVVNFTGGTARRLVPANREATARQVSDIVELTKVLRCESVQDFVNQNGNLVLSSLRHAQPVEADKRVGDVVGSTEMIRQSRSCVQHRLQSTDQVDQKTGQHAVAVIQTR